MKKLFLLVNKHDNSMIDEFESRSDFPERQIRDSILKFWGEQEIKETTINPYKSEHSILTDGKVVMSTDIIEFYLINKTGNEM